VIFLARSSSIDKRKSLAKDNPFLQATARLPVSLISLELAPTTTIHAFPLVSQYERSFLLKVKVTVALPPTLMLTFSNP